MIPYSSIITLLLFSATVNAESCKTPKGTDGTCISIYQCQELLEALRTFNDSQIAHVQRSQCGYDKTPLVCCPKQNSKVEDFFQNRRYCGYQHVDDYEKNDRLRANIDEFPWLASLLFKEKNKSEVLVACGGVLINDRYVLTAAHCVINSLVGVRIGEYNLEQEKDCVEFAQTQLQDCSDPVVEFDVEKTIIHPGYTRFNYTEDIALLRLNATVKYSDFIRPICLPSSTTKLAQTGDVMVTTGWGISNVHGKQVNIKKKVFAQLRPVKECNEFYAKKRVFVNSHQLCTISKNNTEFSCQGDSGAPVMFANKNQWHLEGIVSYGSRCNGTNLYPNVHTKVVDYVDWIVENVKP